MNWTLCGGDGAKLLSLRERPHTIFRIGAWNWNLSSALRTPLPGAKVKVLATLVCPNSLPTVASFGFYVVTEIFRARIQHIAAVSAGRSKGPIAALVSS